MILNIPQSQLKRMSFGGILQPLEGLGNKRLGGRRPLIAKVKRFLDSYYIEEETLNEWKGMVYLSS